MVRRGRAALKRLGLQLLRGDREGAKTALLGVYLDDVEPIEAPLRAADPALCRDIEAHFKELRSEIVGGTPREELDKQLEALLSDDRS